MQGSALIERHAGLYLSGEIFISVPQSSSNVVPMSSSFIGGADERTAELLNGEMPMNAPQSALRFVALHGKPVTAALPPYYIC